MRLKSKILATLTATVLMLSTMTGFAFAAGQASFEDAGSPVREWTEKSTQYANDAWVKLIGGGTTVSDTDTAHQVRKVIAYFSGKGSASIHLIYNSDGGWNEVATQEGDFDGDFQLEANINGKDTTWCETVIQVGNIVGSFQLIRYEYFDDNGNLVFTCGDANESIAVSEVASEPAPITATITSPAEASTSLPKTGVVSSAFFLTLGASAFTTGLSLLKKKD